jgi:arylsulfatase A-like enzyme
MNKRDFIHTIGLAMACYPLTGHAAVAGKGPDKLPNIIYILADDLGIGDVRAFNPGSKIPTPNIDGLAKEGRRFTDAHSGSAVCSPTRYGILTGRYCWRTELKAGVLTYSSNCLIDPDRMTVPSLLKSQGYETACIGKWHLGLERRGTKIDYRKGISFGPNQVGFDYAFYAECTPSLKVKGNHVFDGGIDPSGASPEQLGSAWIENGKVMPECLRNWKQNEVGPTITSKALEVIDRHVQSKTDKPLFMYLALSAVHNPVAPAEFCKGKSGIGEYGDFVCEVDWTVGEVLKSLAKNKMAENTLVIFTSDNGADKGGVKANLEKLGHQVSAIYRGCKADIFEGGHRIPFIARWPGKVKAGSSSDEVICLNDLLATCAALTGTKIPANSGEDSYNILPVLLGNKTQRPIREATVHHSLFGAFAIRQGQWKLILSPDSGGWSAPKPGTAKGLPPVQLYDLKNDIAEKTNLQDKHPEIVKQLTELLEKYKSEGRSTRR